jgi:hypothetical protein
MSFFLHPFLQSPVHLVIAHFGYFDHAAHKQNHGTHGSIFNNGVEPGFACDTAGQEANSNAPSFGCK